MLGFIQCVFFSVFLIIASGVAYSQDMMPLKKNPIDLVDHRAPSDKPFTFTITLPKETENAEKSFTVYFTAGEENKKIGTSVHIDKEEAKGNEVVYTLKTIVPKYEDIFEKVKKEKWHEGWWSARRAQVNISASVAQDNYENSFSFAIPLRKAATFWGVLVLVIFLVIIALMKPNLFPTDTRFSADTRAKKWKEQNHFWFSRLLLYPLHFAITPIGTYSISIAQIVFWTAIVIFASIYVFFIRSEFLHVSEQVLILLGISGGTALAAKANAVVRSQEIPSEFFKGVDRTRIPRLRDLICIGGIPSIFKFQIFAFTLINGIFVLKQLYFHFNFPVIPDKQLILMGISSGVYLGNEITWENIWDAMKKKVDEAKDASNKGDTKTSNALKKEIQKLLKSIYSAT